MMETVQTVPVVISILLLLSGHVLGACSYKGSRICDGAVTKELKSLVQICLNGRLTYKKYEKVKPGYPLAGGGEEILF